MLCKVGDEVASADPAPSEAQNYFAMLQQTPAALLLRLVVQWGCADATAERVAALLGCDLVREPFAISWEAVPSPVPASLTSVIALCPVQIRQPSMVSMTVSLMQVHEVLRACLDPVCLSQKGDGNDRSPGVHLDVSRSPIEQSGLI